MWLLSIINRLLTKQKFVEFLKKKKQLKQPEVYFLIFQDNVSLSRPP